MVQIRGPDLANRPTSGRRASRRGSGGFQVSSQDGGGAAASAPASSVAAMGLGLLALQENGAAAERDARAWRRGKAVLDELRKLQAALLAGPPDPARLAHLVSLAAGEAPADPALASILGAIILRARVELARHQAVAVSSRL